MQHHGRPGRAVVFIPMADGINLVVLVVIWCHNKDDSEQDGW